MRILPALAASLAILALPAGLAAQPQPKGPPPAEDAVPAEKATPPAPPPKEAPAPPVAKKCTLPGGGVRVLTLKQKQCRQQAGCSCASVCQPC